MCRATLTGSNHPFNTYMNMFSVDLQCTSQLIGPINNKILNWYSTNADETADFFFTIPQLSPQTGVRSVLLPVRLQN